MILRQSLFCCCCKAVLTIRLQSGSVPKINTVSVYAGHTRYHASRSALISLLGVCYSIQNVSKFKKIHSFKFCLISLDKVSLNHTL